MEFKIKLNDKKKIMRLLSMVCLMIFVFSSISGIQVHANNWGKNTYNFVKDLAWYAALGAIVVFAVRYIAKRAWVQAGGFLFLGAIVLVIVDDPAKLKNIGTTLWNIVFN